MARNRSTATDFYRDIQGYRGALGLEPQAATNLEIVIVLSPSAILTNAVDIAHTRP
jgi:hypothetical protein